MTPESLDAFFAACAGVAGALIGLLFVAITVAHGRLTGEGADQGHRVRASGALTAFTNAFAISLFALIPGVALGWTASVVGLTGLLFVLGSTLSILRVRHEQPWRFRNAVFLVGLFVTFGLEIGFGIRLGVRPHDKNAAETIAVLVVVCFLIGIARAWELVEGPAIGLGSELFDLARGRRRERQGSPGEPGE